MNTWILSIIIILVLRATNAECPCQANKKKEAGGQRYKETVEEYKYAHKSNAKLNDETLHEEDDSWSPPSDMAFIPGGEVKVGTKSPIFKIDKESPERLVLIEPFYIDKHEVSNKKFREFVEDTNYQTEAEKFGDSFVFKDHLSPDMQIDNKDFRVVNAEWWFKIKGASWRKPQGYDSTIEGLDNYPVIHISWNDANAFCKWQNKRLPTEIEWETACRGGKTGRLYPWGSKLNAQDKHW